MSTVAKKKIPKERLASPPTKAGKANEQPTWLKWFQKQMLEVQQMTASQQHVQTAQIHLLERIHDRLEAIAVESRATNILLADLVAMHQTVITEETDNLRNAIREDVYNRVLNAE